MSGSLKESNEYFQPNRQAFSSLHELVEFVSNHVQCPVTIESRNFELIAYSGNHNRPDIARVDTILRKRVPSHIVNYLYEKGFVHQIENSNGITKIPALDEIGLGPRTVACIRSGNKIYGYFWVQEINNELDDQQCQFLLFAAKEAAKIFDKKIDIQDKQLEETKRIMMSLIQQSYKSEREIRIEAELSGIELPTIFTIVIIRILRSEVKEKIKNNMKFITMSISRTTFLLENNDQFIFIIGSPSPIDGSAIKLAKTLLAKLIKDFNLDLKNDAIVGVGNEYSSLQKIRQSYLEALEVINIKNQFDDNLTHFYQELGVYRLLPFIYEKYKQDHYINEQLMKIKKYDEENQTQLLETLKEYIKNNCRVKETAESLYVHPNTLNYRIKRIQKISNINLDDFEQIMTLYIDLLLYKYKGDFVVSTQISS